MSGKEKVVISDKREEEWCKRIRGGFENDYKSVSGKLLTTMEVALPNGSQLVALKSRIKDIQGRNWAEMMNAEHDIRSSFFEISDSSQKQEESFCKEKEIEFYVLLGRKVRSCLNSSQKAIANLAVLAVGDIKRQEALKEEINRIFVEAEKRISKGIYLRLNKI